MAQNIFDRYLSMVGHWNFTNEQYIVLATASVILAGKMQEEISPSIDHVISLLNYRESRYVSKQALIDLEHDIIVRFGFDFNFPGPVESMDRFLRILDQNKNSRVRRMC